MVNLTREVYCILGLPFDAVSMSTVIENIHKSVKDQIPYFITTPNTNFVIVSQTDKVFRDSVIHSDLCVADGMPVIWVAKMLGLPIVERVSGASFFEKLGESSKPDPLKVYFFGGPDGVAEKASQRLSSVAKSLVSVGYESPGFANVEEMSSVGTIAKINASHADFLVVALGAKKGQAWIEHNRHKLNTPVISHLGAVINFVAGTIRRAPRFFQSSGLEWLWRIYQEPQLWKRYYYDAMQLFKLLTRKIFPYAVWIRFNRKMLNEKTELLVDIQRHGVKLLITPSGACLAQNLSVLKSDVTAALGGCREIELDMSNVSVVDAAFIAFTMLLVGYAEKQGGCLQLRNLNKTNQRIFYWNCANFLLMPV